MLVTKIRNMLRRKERLGKVTLIVNSVKQQHSNVSLKKSQEVMQMEDLVIVIEKEG